MKKIFLLLLLLPVVALAQGGELEVGGETFLYDSIVEKDALSLYYQGETLVASTHEGITLVYKDDQVVLEAHDTEGNGELDTFLTLDSNGEVVKIEGDGAEAFERPEIVELNELIANGGGSEAAAQEDLVGSLDSIKIPGGGIPFGTIVLWLTIVGGGYWFYRKKKAKAE